MPPPLSSSTRPFRAVSGSGSNAETGSFFFHPSSGVTTSRLPEYRSSRHASVSSSIPLSSNNSNSLPSKKKASHSYSGDDVEFWASLYAQHPVYTRHAVSDLPQSSPYPSTAPFLNQQALQPTSKSISSSKVPVKVWQVLTKVDLDSSQTRQRRSKSKPKSFSEADQNHHGAFHFERLPIKAPVASTIPTATALSSNGKPFTIVFFFTIESTLITAAEQDPVSKSQYHTYPPLTPMNSSPTTLWYLETAFTRSKTLHEHMELMGDFVPNESMAAGGQMQGSVPPLYIYETETLDFGQLGGDVGLGLVLDLKLQSPQGVVYAEFSYSFVMEQRSSSAAELAASGQRPKEKSKSRQDTISIEQPGASKESSALSRTRSRTVASARNDMALHRKSTSNRTIDDVADDQDYLGGRPIVSDQVLDAVAEEPDAGEHFVQATSQFFSKMGYWLYNSKVVQYIARDDRVRTKTAFPPEDIWMLGQRYTFELPQEQDTVLVADAESTNIVEGALAELDYCREPLSASPDATNSDMPESHPPTIDQTNVLSYLAVTPPQQSAASSSPPCQEGQWPYLHSQTASKSATLNPQEGEFTAPRSVSLCGRPRATSTSVSTATSTSNSGSPSIVAGFSSMNIRSEEATQEQGISGAASARHMIIRKGQQVQAQQQPLSLVRKSGRRRMTMSGFFSWDGNVAGGTNNSQSPNASVTALKSLVGSSKHQSSLGLALDGRSASKHRQPMLLGMPLGGTAAGQALHGPPTTTIPPIPPMPIPGSLGTSPLNVLPGTCVFANQAHPGMARVRTRARSQTVQGVAPLNLQQLMSTKNVPPFPTPAPVSTPTPAPVSTPTPAPSLADPSGVASAPARERKRKTSRALLTSQTATEIKNIVESTRLSSRSDRFATITAPQAYRDEDMPSATLPSPIHLPSPFKATILTSKRQSSMPISSSVPKTLQQRDEPNSSSPSSLSPLSGSSLRRSWRSLSLSLTSTAKSALPLGLATPSRNRSPATADQKQHQRPLVPGTGFGNEYDEGYNYYIDVTSSSGFSLISLPPTAAAYLSKLRPSATGSLFNDLTRKQEVLLQFLMDFQSRFWFTYRKDLARIEPSFYTCDSGWGCMMRTGQSLLAQAFVQVLLGREWRAHLPQTQYSQRRYTEILSWFADEPERAYSIHRIAKAGLALDKRIGEWFGPSTVAHALRRLSQGHGDSPLSILVPMDGLLRVSSVVQAATHVMQRTSHPAAQASVQVKPTPVLPTAAELKNWPLGAWKPVLVLIPTRFGLDRLVGNYIPNLKQLFRMPQFMGIAGGRPGRSLYFVACQGDELFYYDPHFVKPRAMPEELDTCPLPSFHCPVVRSMDITELDPSMLLGFLIQSPSDLQDLQSQFAGQEMKSYPLLTIQDDLTPSSSQQPEHGQNSRSMSRSAGSFIQDSHNTDRTFAKMRVPASVPSSALATLPAVHAHLTTPDTDFEDVFSIKSLNSEKNQVEEEEEQEKKYMDKDDEGEDDNDTVLV
ncbi:Cysteine protease atg4c [Mortierella claussenii]|nr:Cysteine protease atg4c [Mortierella claussenii]